MSQLSLKEKMLACALKTIMNVVSALLFDMEEYWNIESILLSDFISLDGFGIYIVGELQDIALQNIFFEIPIFVRQSHQAYWHYICYRG